MLNHQKLFLDTTKEYTRQINQLLDMAVTADRKQIMQFTLILNKLKGSLQKLQKQQPKFISLLESTKAEIERLQK